MKEKLTLITLIILVFALLFGGLTWINVQLIQRMDAGQQFLIPWTSARAFVFGGQNPYTAPVSQVGALNLPFYALFLYFPFALVKDFNIAFSLWMSAAELALFGVGFLSIHLAGWKPSVLNAVLFYLTLFFSFYGFYPLLAGSTIVFTTLFLLLMLLSIREGWDEMLGILLVFSTFHPEKGGLAFLLILFWILVERRSRAIVVAVMSLISILIVSFLLLPDWIQPYYEIVSTGLQYDNGFLLSDFIKSWFPERGFVVAQVFRWVAILALVIEWAKVRKRDFHHLMWTVAFSVAILPYLGIHISPYFLSLFLFPLPLLFKNAEDRWGEIMKWFASFLLLLILSSWFIFMNVVNINNILIFTYPTLLLVGLFWVRWWSLRTPHTWMDEVKKYQGG